MDQDYNCPDSKTPAPAGADEKAEDEDRVKGERELEQLEPEEEEGVKQEPAVSQDVDNFLLEEPSGGTEVDGGNYLASLTEQYDEIKALLSGLKLVFDSKIVADEQKDKIIEQMHGELQAYKNDLYGKMLKPLLLDIIQVKNDLHKIASAYQDREEAVVETVKLVELLEQFGLDLADVLEKYDVTAYRCESGSFQADRQKVSRLVDTDDPSLDKLVASSLSFGYESSGKPISLEKVAVYRYRPAAGEADQ